MSTNRQIYTKNQKNAAELLNICHFYRLFIAFSLRLIHRSCRFIVAGRGEFAGRPGMEGAGRSPRFWHCAYPAVLYFFRDKGYLTIISRSRDGELAARMVQRLGFKSFRGSPGSGGATALKQLISAFGKSAGGGFVADGSQGPADIAQKGLLMLALHSGSPILPVGMAAHPCWRFRSWDRTVLAKPFSRVVMAFGPMIRVERGATAERMEEYRVELEAGLNAVTEAAEQAAGGLQKSLDI